MQEQAEGVRLEGGFNRQAWTGILKVALNCSGQTSPQLGATCTRRPYQVDAHQRGGGRTWGGSLRHPLSLISLPILGLVRIEIIKIPLRHHFCPCITSLFWHSPRWPTGWQPAGGSPRQSTHCLRPNINYSRSANIPNFKYPGSPSSLHLSNLHLCDFPHSFASHTLLYRKHLAKTHTLVLLGSPPPPFSDHPRPFQGPLSPFRSSLTSNPKQNLNLISFSLPQFSSVSPWPILVSNNPVSSPRIIHPFGPCIPTPLRAASWYRYHIHTPTPTPTLPPTVQTRLLIPIPTFSILQSRGFLKNPVSIFFIIPLVSIGF